MRYYFKVVARIAIDADDEVEAKIKLREYMDEYMEESEFQLYTDTYFNIQDALDDWEIPEHNIGDFE
jgi:hypothetical protein